MTTVVPQTTILCFMLYGQRHGADMLCMCHARNGHEYAVGLRRHEIYALMSTKAKYPHGRDTAWKTLNPPKICEETGTIIIGCKHESR